MIGKHLRTIFLEASSPIISELLKIIINKQASFEYFMLNMINNLFLFLKNYNFNNF